MNVRIQAYIRVQQIIPNASMKWDLTDVAATKDTGNCGVVSSEIRILIVLVSRPGRGKKGGKREGVEGGKGFQGRGKRGGKAEVVDGGERVLSFMTASQCTSPTNLKEYKSGLYASFFLFAHIMRPWLNQA